MLKKTIMKIIITNNLHSNFEKQKIEEFEGRNATWKSKKVDFLQ
jgi:hypothetical protein